MDTNSLTHTKWECKYHIPFEEKPKNNLPGDNLKYYRQRKSLTTRPLAEQVDVVPATILVYEQK